VCSRRHLELFESLVIRIVLALHELLIDIFKYLICVYIYKLITINRLLSTIDRNNFWEERQGETTGED
jgi:hypothetical protein